ncbi:MAG: hypothetical protein GY906_04845 [bacterium]|nr:hypothetical protein [bacterium]
MADIKFKAGPLGDGEVESISLDLYHEMERENLGICLACGSEREMCEPDAENYPCECCDERQVAGSLHFIITDMIH